MPTLVRQVHTTCPKQLQQGDKLAKRRNATFVKCAWCGTSLNVKNYNTHINKCVEFATALFYNCIHDKPKEERTCQVHDHFDCPAKKHKWCDGDKLLVDICELKAEVYEALHNRTLALSFKVESKSLLNIRE